MTNYFCTYFDSKYLYKGITMYRSLIRMTQDFKLWILCFDDLTYKLLSKINLDKVDLISLEDFEDEDLRRAKQVIGRVLLDVYAVFTTRYITQVS